MATGEIGAYVQGELTGDELETALAEAWNELKSDPTVMNQLGLDGETASTITFQVHEPGGFVAEGILITIGVAWAGAAIWDGTKKLGDVVIARVRARHGDDAVRNLPTDEFGAAPEETEKPAGTED